MDPRCLDGLMNMPEPRTGDQLQQFVCAANWMRATIPEFNKTMAPLSAILEVAYRTAGKRTKRAAGRINLEDVGWGDEHRNSFANVKDALTNAATLAHPHPSKVRCLFSDASLDHWGAVLTQVPPEDGDLSFNEQRHEPLAFLSGSFKGSSHR